MSTAATTLAAEGLPRRVHLFATPQDGAWTRTEERSFDEPITSALLPGEALRLSDLDTE